MIGPTLAQSLDVHARLLFVMSLFLALSCEETRVRVRDSSDDDRRITLEVRRVIAGVQSDATQYAQVQVTTHDGIVQLLGPVSSGGEKAVIGALVEHVTGVRRVDNQLEVRPRP
jgi:osmotically-inducible protein OsmY